MRDLRAAEGASLDPPLEAPRNLGTLTHTGDPGRPRIDISPNDLALLSSGRSRLTDIAIIYDCCARTIRRRMLEFGLAVVHGDSVRILSTMMWPRGLAVAVFISKAREIRRLCHRGD